ncbi:putative tRNA (adenine-N(1)-)-methyltransferase catalytic subunit, partial [Gregarina niphandrodes]
VFQYRSGKFWHDDIIGARFGTRIYDRKTCRQSAVLLRLTPELRTNCLAHRTQVVYAPDLAVASMLLDCNHGRVIVESGTGSGSATLSFARSVGPTGHVHTFENNKARARHAVQEFQQLGVRNVSCYVTDVYRD